jgi:trigger factor
MRATAEPVEGNKVKLSVEVEETEVDKVLDEAVRTLSRQVRVPGFRPGKVPRRVLEARMGGAVALRTEALREALPDFYARAVVDSEIDPITSPEIDITGGEESGPVSFDAVVEVRPVISVPGYAGLQVTVPSPLVTEAEVDAQVDRLRDQEAELVVVDRPAIDGDHVTIDVHGTDASGTEVVGVDDFVYEVGSASVVPELDAELRGATVGRVLAFSATPPGGQEIAFRVLVKEVQEKHLPEVTDDWAAENSDFETVEALRADLSTRIGRMKVVQTQLARRDNTVGALVELVDDEVVPDVLVDQELGERVHDLGHRLEQQRITLEQFLTVTGRGEEDLLEEIRVDARRAVKADLALRAVAEAEDLQVSPEEFEAELAAMAERMSTTVEALRHQLDHAGRTGAVRSEQRKAKALTWLLDHVELVDENGTPVSREDLETDQGVEGEATDDTTGEVGAEAVTATSEDAEPADDQSDGVSGSGPERENEDEE